MEDRLFLRAWRSGSFMSEDNILPGDAPIPAWAYRWEYVRQEPYTTDDGWLGYNIVQVGPSTVFGRAYTIDQIRHAAASFPQHYAILLSNMEGNGYASVVRCVQGFIPVTEDMIVVDKHPAEPTWNTDNFALEK